MNQILGTAFQKNIRRAARRNPERRAARQATTGAYPPISRCRACADVHTKTVTPDLIRGPLAVGQRSSAALCNGCRIKSGMTIFKGGLPARHPQVFQPPSLDDLGKQVAPLRIAFFDQGQRP